MKTFNSTTELVEQYITPNEHGFDSWVIVKITHLEKTSELLATLANPIRNELSQVVVTNVSADEAGHFRSSYQEHYIDQLENRFGFFMPSIRTGDVEYETFDLFKQYWLESEGRNIVPFNIPLLYDFPSDAQYAEATADGTIATPYQRLLVIVAQPRKRAIKRLFIQNVKQADIASIQNTVMSQVAAARQDLFA